MIAYLKNMVDGTLELTERIVAYESIIDYSYASLHLFVCWLIVSSVRSIGA